MKLFDFQEEAVKKFLKVRNVLLGDDMGLGKTVVAIELDRRRRVSEAWHNKRDQKLMKTLVVTLKSTLDSWVEHFSTWNPGLRVMVIDTKNRQPFVDSVLNGSHDVYICHWEAIRLEPKIANRTWFHKVGDEVQKVKNRKAQLTTAWKKVKAEYKTDMSGTWADNLPGDEWSTLNHLYYGTWSSYWRHFNHHVVFQEIVNERSGNKYRKIIGVHDSEGLSARMEPFYVRRTKEEVLKDLPDKYYSKVHVDLYPEQRRAYEQMKSDMLAWIGKHEDEPVAAPVIIAQLTRLQQFAVAHAKLETVKRRVKVNDGFEEVEQQLVRLSEPSSKLDAVMEIIESMPQTESVVVFSKSKQAIVLLGHRLAKAGITYGLLTGDTSQQGRKAVINDFQSGDTRVFAGTIAAGGVGITLTKASTVIFIDRDWSPSANKQAEDRLHRIGQKNAVHVIDIVAKNTVDHAHHAKLQLKWLWIRAILGDKEAQQELREGTQSELGRLGE